MPFAEYRKNVHKANLSNRDTDDAVVKSTFDWYTAGGRDDFVRAFEHETGLKLGNRQEGALVEQGYPKNVNEYPGKAAWNQYYIANAHIALREIDLIYAAGKPYSAGQSELFYHNLVGLSRKLFLDTIVLLEDWATFNQQVPGVFGIGKNRLEHAVAIYHSAMQVIYGKDSPFAFTDNHSDTSINQLRMAIEIRLRRGFGITAKVDRKGAIVPLALSEIIAVIAQHKQSISFAVAFEHVDRLYQWSNIYMHSGLKQYVWSPIYALHYLRPFLLGGRHPRGISANAGIIAPYGVVKQIQAAVESGIDKRRYRLITEDPSNCDLILKT